MSERHAFRLPLDPMMQRWWARMADIMTTNPDNSPADVTLACVFHMA
jgi:L-rhamnose mutarotase